MRPLVGHPGRHDRAANATGELGHASETRRVRARTSECPHYEIVACNLALQIDAARYPADDRVKREQRFEDALHDQRPIVTAREMRRLMDSDLVQFAFVKSPEKRCGEQNRWAAQTRHHGHRNFGRYRDAQSPARPALAEPAFQTNGQ
jgi:hypothetical protein